MTSTNVETSMIFLLLCIVGVYADFSSCNTGYSGNQISATYTLGSERIPVPGHISASLQIQLDTTIDENVRAEVEITRPVWFFNVPVPCVGSGQGVGSCEYSDLCSLLSQVQETCNGQPCTCPVSPGIYSFPNLLFSTGDLHPLIRRVAVNTVFDITLKFFNKNTDALLSCLETQLRTE